MELKYLVVECNELSDQYECDCDRTPVCVTDEKGIEEYQILGYEIYSILSDGKLEKIKDYEEGEDYEEEEEEEIRGCAVYIWHDNDTITKLKELNIVQVEDISLKQVKEIKKEFGCKQSARKIFNECINCGIFYDDENGFTIGEYKGDTPIY